MHTSRKLDFRGFIAGTGRALQNTSRAANRRLAMVAGGAVFLLMLVVVVDVTGRYVLSLPLPGALELTEALLPLVVFLTIAYTQACGGHIRVTMLTDRLSLRKQTLLNLLVNSLGILCFSLLVWKTFSYSWSSWSIRETAWGVVAFPLYPTKFGITLGSLLLLFEFLTGFVSEIVRLVAWKAEG
ncbi:TRAP transporter small permease subunit [Chloroflexota bacterium]